MFAAGLAGPAGRVLRTQAWSAFALLASFGVIAAATLTPSIAAFIPLDRPDGCIGGPFRVPEFTLLLYPNETSLNVAMFVPLGLSCALLRRRFGVAVASVVAAGLPFGIELTQHAAPRLGRVCSSADVVANLTGLAVGLMISIAVIRPMGSWTSIDTVARGPR